MQPAPQDTEMLDEHREHARNGWGGKRAGAGAKPGPQILRDLDRAARLFDVVDSPYLKLAFANLSTPDMMRICAAHLMEAREFKAAGRILNNLFHCERLLGDAPEAPDPDAEPEYVLATDNQPDPAPRPAPRPSSPPPRISTEPKPSYSVLLRSRLLANKSHRSRKRSTRSPGKP